MDVVSIPNHPIASSRQNLSPFSANIGPHEGFEAAAYLAAPTDPSAHDNYRALRPSGSVSAHCAARRRGALGGWCARLCRTRTERRDCLAPQCTTQRIPSGSTRTRGPLHSRFGQRAARTFGAVCGMGVGRAQDRRPAGCGTGYTGHAGSGGPGTGRQHRMVRRLGNSDRRIGPGLDTSTPTTTANPVPA